MSSSFPEPSSPIQPHLLGGPGHEYLWDSNSNYEKLTNSVYGPYNWVVNTVMEPVISTLDLQVVNFSRNP